VISNRILQVSSNVHYRPGPRTSPNLGAPTVAPGNSPQIPGPAPAPAQAVRPNLPAAGQSPAPPPVPAAPGAFSPAGAPSAYKPPAPLPDGILAFDSDNKEYLAKPGELSIPLVFSVTNISGREITIHSLRPTCGCTLAKMPSQPWKMAPNEHGEIHLAIDLRGKRGTLGKSVFIDASEGYKSVYFKVVIPDRPGAMPLAERDRNLQIAAADRQAVFKNDCARCHAEPARNKKGHELYTAACGICHDSEDRAPMVTDLKAILKPTDRAFWTRVISSGIPGTLMPAFARDEGGPLTPEQVESLVEYLDKAYPSKAGGVPAVKKLPATLSE
jgi:mono/diheme cytochrome c family protein